jgi:hypothetical protein
MATSIIITIVAWQIAYTFHFVGDRMPEMKSEIWHQINRKKNAGKYDRLSR